jgi:hypothetical protein
MPKQFNTKYQYVNVLRKIDVKEEHQISAIRVSIDLLWCRKKQAHSQSLKSADWEGLYIGGGFIA